MQTIYQGETGGFLAFDYDASILATSGYTAIVGQAHTIYTLDGLISSGQLLIAKADISVLPAALYIAYPQIIDTDDAIWYLDTLDIEVEYVPS